MRRLFILLLILTYPALALAQSVEPDSSFAIGIERAVIQDSTDLQIPLKVSLENAVEVSAAEFTIVYDSRNLHLLDISPGSLAESFSVFETNTEVPGRIDILLADLSGQTIPPGKAEDLLTISFAVLPGAGMGEYGVLFTKAILADPQANKYLPVISNGGIVNPFSEVVDNYYQYYGSDYAFWVNARNDSPISFYLNNREPISALELRVAYNQEVSEFLGFYDEPRMEQISTREVSQGDGFISLVLTDFSGNTISPGSDKLFTLSFTNTADPSAFFYVEKFIIADSAANRITPKVFYQERYSPFETVTVDTTENQPRMILSTVEVSFGEVPVNQILNKKIIILNLGGADLMVSNISSDNDVFTLSTISASISPNTSRDISISFLPKAEQSFTGTLTITSNGGTMQVTVTGTGVSAPSPGCDFNGDGNINMVDVIALLLFQRSNPGDPRGDFNRDGNVDITDAIAMLLAQRDGTCPDAGALLSSDGAYRQVDKLEGLTGAEIRYLVETMARIDLTAEEEAAFRLALYGRAGKVCLPREFRLNQNSPNPFNPSTAISYSVPEGSAVRINLKVFDLRGRLVRTLVDEVHQAGTHRVFWNGTDETGRKVPSGVYLYCLQAGDWARTRKMVLLK